MKIFKLTLWKVSGVNDTLRHILSYKSLSTKDFSERETLRLVPRDPNLVLHICLRTSLRLAHTAFFNWSLWTSYRTRLASLSSKFLFRDIKRVRGNSSSNNWLSVRLAITWWTYDFIHDFNYTMTDLYASNDVSKIFQGYVEERKSKSLFPMFIPWFVCPSSTPVLPPTTRLWHL